MDKVKAILVLEILGKPKEHIMKVLSDIITKIGEEKEVSIIKKDVAEPKQVEGQEIFTSFAEVEIETNLNALMQIVFAYMPSHIEIIEPENLSLKNSELNLFFNELTRRLHQYDELARAILIERQIIAQQVKEGKIKVERTEEKKPEKKPKKKAKKKKR